MNERETLLQFKAFLEGQRASIEKHLGLVDSRLRVIGRESTEVDEAGFSCPPEPNGYSRSVERAVCEIFKQLPEEFTARGVYKKLRNVRGKHEWSLSTVSALLSRWAKTKDFLQIKQSGSGPQPARYGKVRV